MIAFTPAPTRINSAWTYIDSNPAIGNDATGRVNNPSYPFRTIQAAYAAGARIFDIIGSAGSLILPEGTATGIYIQGAGFGSSTIGDIQIPGGTITIYDVKGKSVYLTQIDVSATAVGGDSGQTGKPGGNFYGFGVYIGGNIYAYGGPGGDSAFDEITAGVGGLGGNVTVQDSYIGAGIVVVGGGGGYGGSASGIGGSGGTAGSVTLRDSIVDSSIAAYGGYQGSGNFAYGGGGSGGQITAYRTTCAGQYDVYQQSGSPDGSPGYLYIVQGFVGSGTGGSYNSIYGVDTVWFGTFAASLS